MARTAYSHQGSAPAPVDLPDRCSLGRCCFGLRNFVCELDLAPLGFAALSPRSHHRPTDYEERTRA